LLRELDDRHPDPYYAALECDVLAAVNHTGIGAGGLGGVTTALGVKIAAYPTHIAGLPVAVSINCWADRRAVVRF
jgi:fumarate hydratase subunit alpha